MGKIAFVFPGQGAQYTGMGQSLAMRSTAAAEVFRMADAIRPGTSQQCFAGSAEELTVTENTQPCMFCSELAAARALEQAGIRADLTAGFSLGEITALTYAGALTDESGFRTVCRRGSLMQESAEAVDAVMVAVVKLSDEQVHAICDGIDSVYPVNFNCPGQIVVSGLQAGIEMLKAAVKAAGGRALPLKVGGGFHSPFMDTAAEKFAVVLAETDVASPHIPVYANATGTAYAGDMKQLMAKQINHPVRWQTCVENMIAAGADTFVEVGPGKVLAGLIAKISGDVRVLNVFDEESLASAVKELQNSAEK